MNIVIHDKNVSGWYAYSVIFSAYLIRIYMAIKHCFIYTYYILVYVYIYIYRPTVSTEYLSSMYRAKIIVTSNPSHWEGGTYPLHY